MLDEERYVGRLWRDTFAMDYCGCCRLPHCTRVCPGCPHNIQKVSGQIVLGHVATDSRAVFLAMTDFHAVRTHDCSSPETSFVGVSAVCACSAVKEGGGV